MMPGLIQTVLTSIATGVGLGTVLVLLLLSITPRRGVAMLHPKE